MRITPEILAQAEQVQRDQQLIRDNHRTGVSYGGLSRAAPEVETVEQIAERLAKRAANLTSFRASPRGRFMQVIAALAEVGCFDTEVSRLRGFYDRQISALNHPALTGEGILAVAECISVLNGIVGRDARAGIDALTDLLREEAHAVPEAA